MLRTTRAGDSGAAYSACASCVSVVGSPCKTVVLRVNSDEGVTFLGQSVVHEAIVGVFIDGDDDEWHKLYMHGRDWDVQIGWISTATSSL